MALTGSLLLWLVVLAIASSGFRRARRGALRLCQAALVAVPALVAFLLPQLEPSLGPNVVPLTWAAGALSLVALLRTLLGKRPSAVVAWLGRRHRALLIALGVLALLASTRRRTPAREPDLLPLVDLGITELSADGVTASGPSPVKNAGRENEPGCQYGCYDHCETTLNDGRGARQSFSSRAYQLSGSWMCEPGPRFVVDPSRHVVHGKIPGLFWDDAESWRYPGLAPTSSPIWTCRLGRLRVAPLDWLATAWLALGLAWLLGRSAHRAGRELGERFARAEEGIHEGDGVVLLRRGDRVRVHAHGDLLRGVVTVFFPATVTTDAYREDLVLTDVVEASLDELMAPQTERVRLLRLAATALALIGLTPMVLALLARLVV